MLALEHDTEPDSDTADVEHIVKHLSNLTNAELEVLIRHYWLDEPIRTMTSISNPSHKLTTALQKVRAAYLAFEQAERGHNGLLLGNGVLRKAGR